MLYLRKRYQLRNEESGEGEGGSAGEGETGQQDDEVVKVEEKARKMGWTPKEEFKGDPDKWRDAASFVERGETMVPILKKTVEKQDRKIAELEKSIKEFAEFHSKTEQRAYQKAFNDLKSRQIEAVSAGNAQAFIAIDQEIAELQKEASESPKISVPKQDDSNPAYEEWVKRNRWAEEDAELAAYAETQADFMRKRGDKREGIEFLDAVKERVKKEYPDKFSNPRRSAAPSVETGSPAQRKGGGKTYADLPAEAKAACDKFVKQFGVKKEDYVKQYFEGEE